MTEQDNAALHCAAHCPAEDEYGVGNCTAGRSRRRRKKKHRRRAKRRREDAEEYMCEEGSVLRGEEDASVHPDGSNDADLECASDPVVVIITGGSGGIGAATVYSLCSLCHESSGSTVSGTADDDHESGETGARVLLHRRIPPFRSATVQIMREHGLHVILACRRPDRADPLLRRVAAEMQSGKILLEAKFVDLSSFQSVRNFVSNISARDLRPNLLINNAGCAIGGALSVEGFEMSFAVNHLGHHLLTVLLLPLLRGNARIVTVSSDAHHHAGRVHYDRVTSRSSTPYGALEYALETLMAVRRALRLLTLRQESKLANVLFTKGLSRRLEEEYPTVSTFAVHPGVVATDVWRHVPRPARVVMKRFMRKPAEGALSTLHCALADGLERKSGGYFHDGEEYEVSPAARDVERQEELWRRSEEWCAASV